MATADAVHDVLERQREDWSRNLGPERAGELIDRLSGGVASPGDRGGGDARPLLRRRAGARRRARSPSCTGVSGAIREVSPARVPTPEEGLRTQRLRREIVAAQREVLMERRDAGELDETVMRRMMRELDLEDESLSSSWIERVRRLMTRTFGPSNGRSAAA